MNELVTVSINPRFAEEVLQWIDDQKDVWPDGTAFANDLDDLRRQIETQMTTMADKD